MLQVGLNDSLSSQVDVKGKIGATYLKENVCQVRQSVIIYCFCLVLTLPLFVTGKSLAGVSLCVFVQVCERTGDLLVCDGHCYGAFHPQCIGLSVAPKGKFLCPECKTGGCTLRL